MYGTVIDMVKWIGIALTHCGVWMMKPLDEVIVSKSPPQAPNAPKLDEIGH